MFVNSIKLTREALKTMSSRSQTQSPRLQPTDNMAEAIKLMQLPENTKPYITLADAVMKEKPKSKEIKLSPLKLIEMCKNLDNGQLFYIRQVNDPMIPSEHRQLPRGVDCNTHWPWQYAGNVMYSGEAFQYRQGVIFVMSTNKKLNWRIERTTGDIHWESTHSVNGSTFYVEQIQEKFIIEFITRIGVHVTKSEEEVHEPFMKKVASAEELRPPNRPFRSLSLQ